MNATDADSRAAGVEPLVHDGAGRTPERRLRPCRSRRSPVTGEDASQPPGRPSGAALPQPPGHAQVAHPGSTILASVVMHAGSKAGVQALRSRPRKPWSGQPDALPADLHGQAPACRQPSFDKWIRSGIPASRKPCNATGRSGRGLGLSPGSGGIRPPPRRADFRSIPSDTRRDPCHPRPNPGPPAAPARSTRFRLVPHPDQAGRRGAAPCRRTWRPSRSQNDCG